jgi:ElaB/YqjD/DUF883 family membrane-anchored ribosome-binding protein
MSRHKRKARGDLETISGYARDLMTATADLSGKKVDEARKRLNDALEQGKEKYNEVRDQALSSLRVADDFICDNPHAAVGIGVFVGVVIGFLLRGRAKAAEAD